MKRMTPAADIKDSLDEESQSKLSGSGQTGGEVQSTIHKEAC